MSASNLDLITQSVHEFTDEKSVISSLQSFNSEFSKTQDIVAKYGKEAKTEFVKEAVEILKKPSISDDLTLAVIQSLRLCSKEPEGLDYLVATETIDLLLQYVGLIPATNKIATSYDIRLEASKCLVNSVFRGSPYTEPVLIRHEIHIKIGDVIRKRDNPNEREIFFPLCRLLFLLALTQNITEILNKQTDTLEVLSGLIISELDSNLPPGQKCSGETIQKLDEIAIQNAGEAMKCIFKISMHLGPLGDVSGRSVPPTEAESTSFKNLVPYMSAILDLPADDKRFFVLRDGCINLLINAPAECSGMFHPERTLEKLTDILEVLTEDTLNPAGSLTPILLVLSSIARAIPRARELLKDRVFPHHKEVTTTPNAVEAPKENADEKTIGGKLIPHMTSINIALKHYVTDFLYVICDLDANELVRMTGFGNAAALLAMNNLFGGLANASSATSLPDAAQAPTLNTQVPEEGESGESKDQVATGRPMGFMEFMPQKNEDKKEMTEEDAQRMVELIEKMEKNGIIKVIRKSDNDNNSS